MVRMFARCWKLGVKTTEFRLWEDVLAGYLPVDLIRVHQTKRV